MKAHLSNLLKSSISLLTIRLMCEQNGLDLKVNLCIKPVKFTKVFTNVVKVISVKLLEMLRYVGMSIIIQ